MAIRDAQGSFDDDWYKPHRPPTPPRQPVPSERLWEYHCERDHARWRCELRDDGPHGIDVQFFKNEEFFASRRFEPRLDPTRPPRELAIAFAEEWRKELDRLRV